MKKAVFITIDVLMIIATIIPVVWLFFECLDSAINGTIHWGAETYIYGLPAFIDTLEFYLIFGLVLVVLWAMLCFATQVFTVITIIVVKKISAREKHHADIIASKNKAPV
jgi:hypothetical protein